MSLIVLEKNLTEEIFFMEVIRNRNGLGYCPRSSCVPLLCHCSARISACISALHSAYNTRSPRFVVEICKIAWRIRIGRCQGGIETGTNGWHAMWNKSKRRGIVVQVARLFRQSDVHQTVGTRELIEWAGRELLVNDVRPIATSGTSRFNWIWSNV